MQENYYFHRDVIEQLKKWIDRKEIYAIKGPRQAGKTTLLMMLKDWLFAQKDVDGKQVVFLNFEDRDLLEKFSQDPKLYVRNLIARQKDRRFYILIDEFHYLQNGGQVLKLLYDTFSNIKFVITGSSSLEIVGHTAKFLVGRVFSFELWQLTFGEFLEVTSNELSNRYDEISKMLKAFLYEGKDMSTPSHDIFGKDFERSFEEYILWGGYPEVVKTQDLETKKVILKNIYDTYVSRDIIELLHITDASLIRRILNALSVQIGSLLNYNNLASDTKSYYREIKHYLSLLEETFIIRLLRPYYSNKITELRKNPKIYFIDLGLRNHLISSFQGFATRPDAGAMVENNVLSQLQRKSDEIAIRYWRTQTKAEVDFILDSPRGAIPIEVKYSSLRSPEISRSFRSFISEHRPSRALVLTRNFWAKRKIDSTNILFVPVWYL